MAFFDFLKEKKNHNLDAPETTLQHREILMRKRFLRKIYEEWYCSFIKTFGELPEGQILEIGSGGGFLKDIATQIITSDVLPLPHCDLVLRAEKLPFADNSLSAIFMIDVLHHIPQSRLFFAEAQRVLKNGGVIFMIEPANTAFGRFVYKNLHHEPFDAKVVEWHFPSNGPLSDANVALPSNIFKRDINLFHKQFEQLHLHSIKYHTPFRYILTGGLSYKSIVPGWSFGFVSALEKFFTPFYPFLAMFHTIRVEKIGGKNK